MLVGTWHVSMLLVVWADRFVGTLASNEGSFMSLLGLRILMTLPLLSSLIRLAWTMQVLLAVPLPRTVVLRLKNLTAMAWVIPLNVRTLVALNGGNFCRKAMTLRMLGFFVGAWTSLEHV